MSRPARLAAILVAVALGAAAPASAADLPHYPGVTTGAATAVTDTTAEIGFTMVATLVDSRAYVQYGTTDALGTQSEPVTIVTGPNPTNATIPLTGLTPETTYTYRVLGTNSGGLRSVGAKMTFTTTPVPPPPPPRRETGGGNGGGSGGGGSTGGGGGAGGGDRVVACTATGARAVSGGSVTLTLDRAFAAAVARAGRRLAGARPATLSGRALKLPVTGGALDRAVRSGRLCIGGGLTLGGRASVALSAFSLQLTARRPQLSVRIGRGTVALATLAPVVLAGRGRTRTAAAVRATFTSAGASALRTALRATAPRAGATLGTLALRLTLR